MSGHSAWGGLGPFSGGWSARNPEGDSLEADVMRFMAILGFCLLAIFALVQSLPGGPTPPVLSIPEGGVERRLRSELAAVRAQLAAVESQWSQLREAVREQTREAAALAREESRRRDTLQASLTAMRGALDERERRIAELQVALAREGERRERLAEALQIEGLRLERLQRELVALAGALQHRGGLADAAATEPERTTPRQPAERGPHPAASGDPVVPGQEPREQVREGAVGMPSGNRSASAASQDPEEPDPQVRSQSPSAAPPESLAATVPTGSDPAAPGFSLRFASDEALLALMATGEVTAFARTGPQAFQVLATGTLRPVDRIPAGYEMAAATVPERLAAALQQRRAPPEAGPPTWVVVLPGRVETQLRRLLQSGPPGPLVIEADGTVRNR